jgi:hypothetical protein
MSNQPKTVQDYIDLLVAVKEKYGNLEVQCASDISGAMGDDTFSFYDVVVANRVQSLTRDDRIADDLAPKLVFILDSLIIRH